VHASQYKVDVIDSISGALLRTLDLSNYAGPYARLGKIAINENTNTLYMGLGSASLLVVDGNNDSVIKVITGVETFPDGIGVNPYTGNVNVAATNAVYWINGNTSSNPPYSKVGITYNPVPQEVAVNPFTNLVYVTLFNEQSCVAIDGTSHQVLFRIPVGLQPRGLAVNPWTNTIYVTSEYQGLSVIDGNTHSVIARLRPKTSWGTDAVLGPIGVNYHTNRIYLTGSNNDILTIDGATNQQIGAVHEGGRLMDLAVDSEANRIFLPQYESNSVSIYSDDAASIASPPQVWIEAPSNGSAIRQLPMPLTGRCENNLGAASINSVQWQLMRVSPSATPYWDAIAGTWVSTAVLNGTTPGRPVNSSEWYSAGSIPQDNSATGGPNNLPPGDYALTVYGNDGTRSVSKTHSFAVVGAAIVKPASQFTSEKGDQSTFEIHLSTRPSLPVSFDITSSNPAEGTVAASSVVFTPDNWNQPHLVTVSGVDDQFADGSQNYQIVVSPSRCEDPVFAGLTVGALDLTNQDNDVPALHLVISSQNVTEGSSVIGTLTRNTREALTVNLSASDAQVPAAITIPANVFTATFGIQTQDDGVAAGNRTLTIIASSGSLSATQALTLTDKSVPTLTLQLAASNIAENATSTIIGILTRNTPTFGALSVTLSSSDTTEARVPASVTIPAGSTSTTFDINSVDDLLADGTRAVMISAGATGFAAPGTATLNVTDNETPQLLLSIAPNRTSETGVATATLKRNSEVLAMTAALTITVSLNIAGQVTVPATVTIPKGAASTSFAVRAVNDTAADGPRTVTLTARATGFTSSAADITVTDNEVASNGTVAGKVLLPATSGALPVSGVTLTLRQGTTLLDTATSSSNGTYRFSGLPRGNYTVTLQKASYTFAPISRVVTLPLTGTTTMNVTDLDFVGTPRAQISGVLTKKDAAGKIVPLANAKMVARSSLSTLQVTTSSNGAFLFDRLPLGNYAVAPLMTGSVFSPKVRTVTLNTTTPVVNGTDFLLSSTDTIAPAVPVVKTPAANVTTATQSTLTTTGTATDNNGGSGLAVVSVSIARFSSATATTPNGFLNWSNKAFITTDSPLQVEALTTGITTWSLAGPALSTLRSLPAGFYAVRATAVDNAANLQRSTWKRFTITSTTRSQSVEVVTTPTSAVQLSSAQASIDGIVLRFTGAISSSDARETATYEVHVNGDSVAIESASYNSNTIVLGLPEGAIKAGDNLQITWRKLRDSRGRILAAPNITFHVR
jgi:DNA-binding beta-propeller fold protein YncE